MEGGADDDFAAGKKRRRSKADFETQNNNPEASGFGVERRNKRSGTNVNRHSLSAVPVDAVERTLLRRGASVLTAFEQKSP